MNCFQDDRELVRRLLRRDEEAFREFFDGYFPRLYRFARARLDDPGDVDEVVQSTLIQVVRKLSTYRGEAALFTWLCTFCRREISALWKRRDRRPQEVDLLERNPEIRAALESLPTATGHEPDVALHRSEIARLVQVTLDHLPHHYGNALEWKYIEGHTVREIADLLQIGPKAAESLLTRARQAFRAEFAALSDDLAGGRSPA